MGHFFLFRMGDQIVCSFSDKLREAEALHLDGHRYFRNEQIPIFDHLLTAENKLAGFCLHALDYTPTMKAGRLLTAGNVFDQCSNWEMFDVVLTGQTPDSLHNDGCACLAADVYFDGANAHVIAVPDSWSHHWRGLAFDLHPMDVAVG